MCRTRPAPKPRVKKADAKNGAARILINCAGIGKAGRIVGRDGPMPLGNYERVIQINLIGTFNMLRLVAAGPAGAEPMEEGERGVIVNTARSPLTRPDRPGGLFVLEGRHRGTDAAGGARICAVRHPRAAPSRRAFSHADADGRCRRRRRSPRRLGAVPAAAGQAEQYAALVLHIVENRYLNGEVIRLDGALRMAPR